MRQHVLVVDDDANFLDGLRRIWRGHRRRWEMTFMTSVDDAVECVDTKAIDAIVSDVMLPGRNGFDLLRAISASPSSRHVPVTIAPAAPVACVRG